MVKPILPHPLRTLSPVPSSCLIELGAGDSRCPDHEEGWRVSFIPFSPSLKATVAAAGSQLNGLEANGIMAERPHEGHPACIHCRCLPSPLS